MLKKLITILGVSAPLITYYLGRWVVINGIYKDIEKVDVVKYQLKNRPVIYVFSEDAVIKSKDTGFVFKTKDEEEVDQ